MVAKGSVELMARWSNLQRSMLSRIDQLISNAHWTMRKLDPMNSLLRYQERLKTTRGLVNHSQEKMIRTMLNKLAVSKHKLDNLRAQVEALGPYNVLSRGFSILQAEDGRVIRDAMEVSPGDFVEAHLFRGKLRLRVEACEPAEDPSDTNVSDAIDLHILDASILETAPTDPVPSKVALEPHIDATVPEKADGQATTDVIDDREYDQRVREMFMSGAADDLEEIAGKVAEARIVSEPINSGSPPATASSRRGSSAAKSKSKPPKASDEANPDSKQLRLTF
jgi:hypothetical protein